MVLYNVALARAPSVMMVSESPVTTAVVGKVVPTGGVQSWYDSGLRLDGTSVGAAPAPASAPTRTAAWNPKGLDVSKLPVKAAEQFMPTYLQTCVLRIGTLFLGRALILTTRA